MEIHARTLHKYLVTVAVFSAFSLEPEPLFQRFHIVEVYASAAKGMNEKKSPEFIKYL